MSDAILEVRFFEETQETWDELLDLVSVISHESIEARNKILIEEALDFEYITFTESEYFQWFNEFYEIDPSVELYEQDQPDFVKKEYETARNIFLECDSLVQVYSLGKLQQYRADEAPSILEAAKEHQYADWREYSRTGKIPSIYYIKADDLREFLETRGKDL